MHNFRIIQFPNADQLAEAVAAGWLKEVTIANRAGRPQLVALSGGRITLRFFAAVIDLAASTKTSLAGVHFFWADERCVAADDPESNYGVALKSFFQPLGVAADKIHRIQGEHEPQRAAELATAELKRFVPLNAAGQPVFDLIFLGMGEDGHVASLFPSEPETMREDLEIYRAITNSPKPPPNRVTLGYAAIAAATQVWVLVSGTGKETAMWDSRQPGGRTPLSQVLKSRLNTKLFTDIPVKSAPL